MASNNNLGNVNIVIELTKIAGVKVMDIQGKTCKKKCVVIPIDNKVGTVCDGYTAKDPESGLPTTRFLNEVCMYLVGFEHRKKKNNITHGLKPNFNPEYQEKMTEEQTYAVPWCGNIKPWKRIADSEAGDDHPADDAQDW